MGRHSDPRDTAGNGPDSPQDALDAPGAGNGTPEAGTDDLRLPFDPDDVALWDFQPFLRRERPHVTVELPEADQ